MKAVLMTGMSVVLVLGLASQAFGQHRYAPGGPSFWSPTYYDHASTWEEGVLRGTGALLRGAGEMNYNNSLAAVNLQEAYRRYLENRIQAASTYFDLRQLNREARAEERGQRTTAEAAARYAKMRTPDRLAAFHFDATGNRLIWPEVFHDPQFAAERETIDRLMPRRSGRGGESSEIQLLAENMTEKLRREVHAMRPNDYMAARRFLASLEHEMNFAPIPTGVAAR